MVLNNPLFVARNSRSGYQIEQSLRFDGSSYLSWDDTVTPDVAARDLWTLSVWIKRGTLTNQQGIFSAYQNENNRQRITFQSDNTLQSEERGGGASKEESTTNELFRDPSAWYHLTFLYDVNAPGGSDDYVQFWINGVRSNETNAARVDDWAGVVGDNGTTHNIGRVLVSSPTSYFNGYLAELHLCPGQRKSPTDFGEYDNNGVWRPIEYTGSYGTHGYYLKFDSSATNGIGHDHSGNGNHFTATNFTTSDSTNPRFVDVVTDTPTNNFATFSPLYNYESPYSLVEANLKVDTNSGSNVQNSTIGVTSGKFYAEYYCESSNSVSFKLGIQDLTGDQPSNPEQNTWTLMFQGNTNNYIFENGSFTLVTSGSISWNNGDYVGLALDADARTCRLYVNGSLSCTIDFSSYFGAGERVLAFMHCYAAGSGAAITWINFGQQPWKYAPPSGYEALCTANLPAPDIADGSQYFNTITYSGNGTQPRSLTGVGFQPSWLWIKRRSGTNLHHLVDEVRGVGNAMASDSTLSDFGSQIGSFDSDGFTTNNNAGNAVNGSGSTYVAWSWLASNTSGSSNTAGSITSTVSANPTAGFSIATYTGNGTAGATIGHGLGVAPAFAIFKSRNASRDWLVYHQSLGATKGIYLSLTLAAETDAGFFNNTAPTSTVMTLGNNSAINVGSQTQVAHFFAEVEGYSKFGSYTGNGSSDGPFVALNFKPHWLMIKRSDSTESWLIFDSKRETYNPTDDVLWANLINAESANYTPQDFLSNGFKIRTSSTSTNASGGTYIFAAFSENPFGGSGVSPVTAR